MLACPADMPLSPFLRRLLFAPDPPQGPYEVEAQYLYEAGYEDARVATYRLLMRGYSREQATRLIASWRAPHKP